MAGPARAGGFVDHSSTGTTKWIPQIWSGKLVEKFYDATVFGAICNTDYEGEISDLGDTVIIRTVPTVAISDYTIGGGVTYENLTSLPTQLDIDKAKYFAFGVNDVDKYQSDIAEMDKWSDETSNQMKIAIDTDLLAQVYPSAAAFNAGLTGGRISGNLNFGTAASPRSITKDNIIQYIVDMGQALDEANVPEMMRWVVAPAWFCSRIKVSDLKDASISGDNVSPMRNGRIGVVDRFTIYMSNLLNSTSGDFDIIFGHPAGITFASQMVKMERLPNPDDFGELVRGLNVYGYDVINDAALGHAVAAAG